MTSTTCPLCGTDVAYLNGHPMNLSKRYDNGARYYRGSHTATCDGGAARAARIAEDAKHARQQRRAAGARRYLEAYKATHTADEYIERNMEVMEYVYA